jgi:predicted RND superfamily exporter protein
VSAETGLCNVAQKGLWDVDGQGLTKVEDPILARRLLDRVNAMNIQNGLQATGIAALFAVLPKSMTQSAAIVVALGALLYLLQDKLPKEIE